MKIFNALFNKKHIMRNKLIITANTSHLPSEKQAKRIAEDENLMQYYEMLANQLKATIKHSK